jgi:acetylornithine deacetylase/succinyl-diaminopimelate desuccinylase-like protein
MTEIKEEVSSLLSDLIRIDTTNPPGNETKAAEFLADHLEKRGLPCEMLESSKGRGSIVTRIEGSGEKPSVLLLSHLDVVAANPKEWSVDPFGGLIRDGFVWGRGALDMKSMTAIEIVVLESLRRRGIKLKGDVILAATADEEKGGEAGAGWLVKNHPEKVRADYVLNEGGGLAMPVEGKNLFTVQTSEKGILWFKVQARGTPGHGSVPTAADNAIMRMNNVISRLSAYRAEVKLVPTVLSYLRELAKTDVTIGAKLSVLLEDNSKVDEVLDSFPSTHRTLAEEIRALTRMTVTPTIIHGGVKENIIPSACEATFDCRVLPGESPRHALSMFRRLLADVGLEKLDFDVIQANEPSESSLDTPFFRVIESVLREFEPDCSVAPSMLTGGTDSRFFRRLGSVCYGFQPMRSDMPYGEIQESIHGVDERISTDNLVFGVSMLYRVLDSFLG